jgi:hypothetical protein
MKLYPLVLTLSLLASPLFSGPAVAGSPLDRTYDIHLKLGGHDYVDVLKLTYDEKGELKGHMSVPNDFEADVEGLYFVSVVTSFGVPPRIRFDLPVPHNSSRPKDLVFHYSGSGRANSSAIFDGIVTLGETEVIGSFVAILR